MLPSATFSEFVENFFNNNNASGRNPEQNNPDVQKPAVNILENNDDVILEVAAPGLKKEDFNLKLDKNFLHITSARKQEDDKGYIRKEFGCGNYERIFELPNSLDTEKIKANYQNGILQINLPKKEEAKVKPSRIINIS